MSSAPCPAGPPARSLAASAGGQSHIDQLTVIRPGPHSWPFAQRSGTPPVPTPHPHRHDWNTRPNAKGTEAVWTLRLTVHQMTARGALAEVHRRQGLTRSATAAQGPRPLWARQFSDSRRRRRAASSSTRASILAAMSARQ
jgi:hypothetical protein